MAQISSTDLTEEDAADLQFPKDIDFTSFASIRKSNAFPINECANCENHLEDTFILCVQCDLNICTDCFANGVVFGNHKNDHDYKVLRNDFILFEYSDWTAREEMILLNGLLNCNNFYKIAKDLPDRTALEIKKHYDYFYLQRHGSTLFPSTKIHTDCISHEPIIPYRFQLANATNPIRNNTNTPAGYNAARSDFEIDYDRNAEEAVAALEFCEPNDQNYTIICENQMEILDQYRSRVIERQRRKDIIREHGLIMPEKTTAWLHRYDNTITPPVYEKLLRFMQFYTFDQFQYLLEGLHRAGELKIKIARLCQFRKLGIRTLAEADLYLKLKAHRDESIRSIRQFYNINEINLSRYKFSGMQISGPFKRRIMTPLEISGMLGYSLLTPKECDLCSAARLTPTSYLELKALLIAENNKLGHLKLLNARRLLKIDVNKTRKLYDFLVREGFIKKPS